MTANPPVPGGGRPLPCRSQQMVDETGFPRGKGSRNCPTFCSFQPALHVSLMACPCPEGPCWPSRAWGHARVWLLPSCWDVQGQPSWIQAGAGSLGSLQHSSSGLGKKSQAVPASLSVKYLGKRGGDLFKMQIHCSRVKPGNLHCY